MGAITKIDGTGLDRHKFTRSIIADNAQQFFPRSDKTLALAAAWATARRTGTHVCRLVDAQASGSVFFFRKGAVALLGPRLGGCFG